MKAHPHWPYLCRVPCHQSVLGVLEIMYTASFYLSKMVIQVLSLRLLVLQV